MENASKALIMAGGILTSLLIIGLLVLMFNQISVYQKSATELEKESQLASFNEEFAKYAEEKKIQGIDIISLANKIVDFNKKDGVENSVNYEQKITLKVDLTGFARKYGVNGKSKIFNKETAYSIVDNNNNFMKVITKFSGMESTYTLSTMNKLSSYYDSLVSGEKTIKEITGKEINTITMEDIEKYREYSELKKSTFIVSEDPIYKNGQIEKLSFKFKE